MPAVLVAVYGNRAYEDALLELRDESRKHGFLPWQPEPLSAATASPTGWGAAVPTGTTSPQPGPWVGTPRPPGRADAAALTLDVPGNFPTPPLPICPWPLSTDTGKCGGCMACQKSCPVQAINPWTCPRPTAGAACSAPNASSPVPTAPGTSAFPLLEEDRRHGGHVLRPQAA